MRQFSSGKKHELTRLSFVQASSEFLSVEETHLIVKMSQVVLGLAGAAAGKAGEEAPDDSWQSIDRIQSR